jgi:thiamine pyrophosphate-dependent acetolactate synthase large subunit-like protein
MSDQMKDTPAARNTKVMNRFDLTKRLVAKLKHEEAVIGGIGNTNFDLWSAGHRPQNFYMLGSMGLAFPIALGVALAQPQRRVIALEGDGSLLMQLGCLSTIASLAPKNLSLIVWTTASTRSPARSRPRPPRRQTLSPSRRVAESRAVRGPPTKNILSGWSTSHCRQPFRR